LDLYSGSKFEKHTVVSN